MTPNLFLILGLLGAREFAIVNKKMHLFPLPPWALARANAEPDPSFASQYGSHVDHATITTANFMHDIVSTLIFFSDLASQKHYIHFQH